jgi:anaerobic ribonucleoside-triphosphate reductase activating protein
MRYAGYDDYEIVNGTGGGMSIYIQGCHKRCQNCFNPETWDFNGGKPWTLEVRNKFYELLNRQYIKRCSILGGEPLADENLDDVLQLVQGIRTLFGNSKAIWLYTGFKWEFTQAIIGTPFGYDEEINNVIESQKKRKEILKQCDVLIDGEYIDSLRNPSLKWRGSANQRVIDIQQSLKKGKAVLWAT